MHAAIQVVTEWYDYHLHVFTVGGMEIGDLEEEFSDYIVDNMAEYSTTWARENGLFLSEEPVPSGGIEDFMEYLIENNVDMDDPEAVKKDFGAFTVQ